MQPSTVPPIEPIPAPVGTSIAAHGGIPIAQARARQYEVFELPAEVPINERQIELDGQRFAILEVWFALLTLQEDKLIAQRAGDYSANPTILAHLKTTAALRFVRAAVISSTLDREGKPVESFDSSHPVEFSCSVHDGSAEGVYAAMHPGMRDVTIMAYAASASIAESHAARFLKSRRTAVR